MHLGGQVELELEHSIPVTKTGHPLLKGCKQGADLLKSVEYGLERLDEE